MNIGIVGLGYVGFSLMEAAHKANHSLIGIDKSESTIEILKSSQKFTDHILTSDFSALLGADIVVIAVPTPINEERVPDLTSLKNALQNLKFNLKLGTLIINESTSYPGTLRNLVAEIIGPDFKYAAAPERVDPASANWNISNTPRLISGITPDATKKAIEFYSTICEKIIEVSSPEVAEAAKLLENTFRQVNIALVNEFAQIAEKFKISAIETINAAASKPFGYMPFFPGIGVGGHCIPVDPTYLSFAVEKLGGDAKFIDLANKVNLEMPTYIAKRIANDFGGNLEGKEIQLAGIAYKPNVSDLRESPALTLIHELKALGAKISWHDPLVKEWSGEKSAPLLTNIDLGLVVTPHEIIDFKPWLRGDIKVLDLSATSQNLGWTKYL